MMSNNVFFLQLQKTSDEQKSKIRKFERALKVAEVLQLVLPKNLILCQILGDGSYVFLFSFFFSFFFFLNFKGGND